MEQVLCGCGVCHGVCDCGAAVPSQAGRRQGPYHVPLLQRPMFYSSRVSLGAPPSFPRALESSWKELGGKAEQSASLKAFVQASMSAEVHPVSPREAFW